MAEETILTTEEQAEPDRTEFRRKRVKRIKVFLIFLLLILLLIPNVICGILLYRLYQMDRHIDSLQEEIKISKEEIARKSREAAAESKEVKKEREGLLHFVEKDLTDEETYPDKQLVYLTFDDGPSKYTDEILDILKEQDVKATFFVLANDGFEEQYQRILDEGHTLGIHSYSHRYSSIYYSLDAFKEDVTSVADHVEQITGIRPKFYRFPGGSSNTVSNVPMQDMIHFLSSDGYVYYDWNVSSEDASKTMLSADTIVRNVTGGIGDKKQSVVLMHDAASKRSTVEALPVIIETLKQKGNVVFLPITDATNQVVHVTEKKEGTLSAPAKEDAAVTDEAVETAETEIFAAEDTAKKAGDGTETE